MNASLQHAGFHLSCDAHIGPLRIQVDQVFSAGWTVLFGPSGSGKSTLLRLLAGLWSPRGTNMSLAGVDVSRLPPHRRNIALVAQQPALFPHRTVRDNVLFGSRRDTEEIGFIDELLKAFELQQLGNKYSQMISGGEQQRTSLARAIATRPRLLLLDEAFTGIHRTQQTRLIATVRDYSKKLDMPVLSVTHDIAEAFRCGEEVLRMDAGRIIARGPAEEVLAEERASLLQTLRVCEAT